MEAIIESEMQEAGFNRCKVCSRYMTSQYASYCSKKCRDLHTRLGYSGYGLKVVFTGLILLVIIGISQKINWYYITFAFFGLMFVILVPLYQLYQTTLAEIEMRSYYQSKKRISYPGYEENLQPVHIYLYISRNQEDRETNEDFSEFT